MHLAARFDGLGHLVCHPEATDDQRHGERDHAALKAAGALRFADLVFDGCKNGYETQCQGCLLYTSDAATKRIV